MKAKMYVHNEKNTVKVEAIFEDETIYANMKEETQEEFTQRLKDIVNNEYLDDEFDVIVIGKEEVELNEDATLLEAYETAVGLKKKIIGDVLADRKLGGKPAAKLRDKVVAKTAEEMKASDYYKAAEANIGKHVSFSPFKSEEVYEGKIAGVALNKTNTIVYYTVVEANGKRRCCGVKNETVKFIAAPIVAATEKPAKVKTVKTKVEKTETVDETVAPGASLGDAEGDLM